MSRQTNRETDRRTDRQKQKHNRFSSQEVITSELMYFLNVFKAVTRSQIITTDITGLDWKWRTWNWRTFENRLHYNAVCNSFQNNGRIQVTAAK